MRSKKWAAASHAREGIHFVPTYNADPLKGFYQAFVCFTFKVFLGYKQIIDCRVRNESRETS